MNAERVCRKCERVYRPSRKGTFYCHACRHGVPRTCLGCQAVYFSSKLKYKKGLQVFCKSTCRGYEIVECVACGNPEERGLMWEGFCFRPRCQFTRRNRGPYFRCLSDRKIDTAALSDGDKKLAVLSGEDKKLAVLSGEDKKTEAVPWRYRKGERTCDECGVAFIPRARHQRFCSRACNHKEKNKRRGNYRKQIIPKIIVQGGACGICHGRLPFEASKIHLDHIVPVQEDGTNDPDNLRAVCSSCHFSRPAAERGRPFESLMTRRRKPDFLYPWDYMAEENPA